MRTVPLGEVTEVVSGATPKSTTAEYWDGEVLWATPADLGKLDGPYISETPRKLTERGLRSCAATVLPTGSVLLSSRAPIGHVAINTRPMATNQGFKSLVPRDNLLDSKFLYHWLVSNTEHLQSLGNGATFKELSKATVERIEMPLPLLVEQRRIAAILDQADAICTKRRQVLAHLDALTQSIFHDMFGSLPWESRLGDLAQVQIGPFGSLLHREDYVYGGVAVINPMHVRDGELAPDPHFSVTFAKAATLPQYRMRTGDVVVGRRGEMGRAGVAREEHDGLLCGTGSLILRPRQAHSEFLHALVTSSRMKRHLEESALGVTMLNLNASIMSASPAPAAGMPSQRVFGTRVGHVNVQRAVAHRALAAANELFASLQARAFRGEL